MPKLEFREITEPELIEELEPLDLIEAQLMLDYIVPGHFVLFHKDGMYSVWGPKHNFEY